MPEQDSANIAGILTTQPTESSSHKSAVLSSIILLSFLLGVTLLIVEIRNYRAVNKLNVRISEMETKLKEFDLQIEWKDAQNTLAWWGDPIVPEANTIQFMKRGYSIQFEQVSYEPGGLHLIGYLGNPFNFWLSNVSLKFSARKSFWYDDYKKKFDAQLKSGELYLFPQPEEFGNAQTAAIPFLSSGQRGRFDVTIPNVHQTKDGIALYVSFAGERYGYPQ